MKVTIKHLLSGESTLDRVAKVIIFLALTVFLLREAYTFGVYLGKLM